MPSILLIPGFATDLRVGSIRPPLGADGGFSAFRAEVATGVAEVFRWGIKEHVAMEQAADPRPYASLYDRERERAASPDIQRQLLETLETSKCRTVVCHSMGCHLLLSLADRHVLPATVERIVFVQGDFDATHPFPETFRNGKNLRIDNFYCSWDPILALSASIHRMPRAGQVGWKVADVKNRFVPLLRPWNLHTATIRSSALRSFVVEETASA